MSCLRSVILGSSAAHHHRQLCSASVSGLTPFCHMLASCLLLPLPSAPACRLHANCFMPLCLFVNEADLEQQQRTPSVAPHRLQHCLGTWHSASAPRGDQPSVATIRTSHMGNTPLWSPTPRTTQISTTMKQARAASIQHTLAAVICTPASSSNMLFRQLCGTARRHCSIRPRNCTTSDIEALRTALHNKNTAQALATSDLHACFSVGFRACSFPSSGSLALPPLVLQSLVQPIASTASRSIQSNEGISTPSAPSEIEARQ